MPSKINMLPFHTFKPELQLKNFVKTSCSSADRESSPSLMILFHMPDRWSLNTTRKSKKKKLNTIFLSVSIKRFINKGDVSSESLTRNIGYFELKQIYSDLNLSSFFNKICEGRRITFDSNAINMTLSVLRVLDPGSKQQHHQKEYECLLL